MTPNTRKPTKKTLPDNVLCWAWHNDLRVWSVVNGERLRLRWGDWYFNRWLPYSAIPDPNNTTKEQTA